MKKSILIPICITMCFLFVGLGVFIGRLSAFTRPAGELIDESDTKPPLVSTIFDQPEFINGKLNVNVASKENLCLLPGVGDGLAEKIIEYRQTVGPFASVEELKFVDGLGEKKLAAISDYVTVMD